MIPGPPTAALDLTRALGTGDSAQVRRAAQGCDAAAWEALIADASPLVLPYLEYRLRQATVLSEVPPSAREQLLKSRETAVATSLMRRDALQLAIRSLDERGVPSVLLKGAGVALTVYPEFYLRPMADIDLWVEPAGLTRAVECLLSNGFVASQDSAADGRVSPGLSQHRLVAPRTGIRVELHGQPHSLEGLSADLRERCWRRAVVVPNLEHARVLESTDALLHTSLHLSRSNGFAESQLGLLDIALLIGASNQTLDWHSLAADVTREQVAVHVALAVQLSQAVWGAAVPPGFLVDVRDMPSFPEMYALAIQQVWARRTRLPAALDAAFREQRRAQRLATFRRRVMGTATTTGSSSRVESTLLQLRHKTPRYLRAWSSGELAPRELARRARLATSRGRLAALIESSKRYRAREWPAKQSLFGVEVSVTNYDELTHCIVRAAREHRGGCVTALAVHGLITAHDDRGFRDILDSFEAVAPDGQPVRLGLNALYGARLPDRVRGVDLAFAICRGAERYGLRLYLLGSRREVVEALQRELRVTLPGLLIVGAEPGQYEPNDPARDAALVARINQSGADLLLVGMGCPHQERFAFAHRSTLRAVQVCVGSAFDVLGKTQPNAPKWMQALALEWLFRLAHEPQRLWRRYLFTNARFLVISVREIARRLVSRFTRR